MAATLKYNIPDDIWRLVANLHPDLKATLTGASDQEWDLLRQQERERNKARRFQNRSTANSASASGESPSVPAHSVPWHALPKRVQRLLAGLTILAEEPDRQLSAASYRDLMPFVGGSRPQVPQALTLAKELQVVTVWMEATHSNQGRTSYCFIYYPQALALGLSLAYQIDVSMTEIDTALAAGFTAGEIRERFCVARTQTATRDEATVETMVRNEADAGGEASTEGASDGPTLAVEPGLFSTGQVLDTTYPPGDNGVRKAYPEVDNVDSVDGGAYRAVMTWGKPDVSAYPRCGQLPWRVPGAGNARTLQRPP